MQSRFKEEPKGEDVPGRTKGTSTKPMASDQPAVDWWAAYVSSPKYKQRLSAFYKYPDVVQRERSKVLNSIGYRENTGTRSAYYDNGNEIAMSDVQIKSLGASRGEVMAHELGHSVNSNRYASGAKLSLAEEDFILRRNKQLASGAADRWKALSKETGKPISNLMPNDIHDGMPTENLSDVQALRFLLKQRGLYDAGKDDIDSKILQKAAADPVIRKSFIWKRLKESFDDKELQEIMNKIAANKSTKNQNMA